MIGTSDRRILPEGWIDLSQGKMILTHDRGSLPPEKINLYVGQNGFVGGLREFFFAADERSLRIGGYLSAESAHRIRATTSRSTHGNFNLEQWNQLGQRCVVGTGIDWR